MATSGTVGQTVLDTAKVLEHAFRRAKIPPSKQTPETVLVAQENLFLILTSMASRGLNLWAIDQYLVGLEEGRQTYDCPTGTIQLLNLLYTQVTRATGTDTTDAASITTSLSSATLISRIGVKASAVVASDTLTLSYSDDGISWTTILTETRTDWATGEWYWYDVPVELSKLYYKAAFTTGPATFSEFYLAATVSELPVAQLNRDTWAVVNNKSQTGRPSTNYYFEKLVAPRLSLWPVPNNSYDHLVLYVHRQVQDIGTLTQNIEVPSRWYEPIIWQLSARVGAETPDADDARVQFCFEMAEKVTDQVEMEESDGAPFTLTPNIRVYTR